MTLMICVDEKGGLLFFGKRQSRDSRVQEEMLALAGKKPLRVTPYTAKQFVSSEKLFVCDDPLEGAGAGDFVFLEDTPLPEGGFSRMVLYRWNRHYPADRFLSKAPADLGMKLVSRREFAGSSHKTVTEEIWEASL